MIGRVEIDPNYKGPMKVESFLQKLKSQKAKARIFKKFNKRWFVLDLNQGTFAYSRKQNSNKIEQSHPVTDIIRVDPNPQIAQTCDWKFAFTVETRARVYVLYSESQNMHRLWCVALKAVLLPSEGPRPPISSGVPQSAAEEYPRRYNSSGYPDERYYTNPPPSDQYNSRASTQYRNSYQEPGQSKANARGGYNKLEEFPSHPGDVDFQPNITNPVNIPKESDFRTMPPPSRNEDPYTDNYSDQKRSTANRDPNYREEPEPYRANEEAPKFKHSSSIREDPSQIKREVSDVQPRKSDFSGTNEPRKVQRDEYYARDNYRQQPTAEPPQYQRKPTPKQWGDERSDPSYNPPRSADYQTENRGYNRDYYNPKTAQEPVSNFDRSREQGSYGRPEEYGYREPERKEVPRYEQQSQYQTEPRRDEGYNPLKRDDPPRGLYNSRSREYLELSTGYSSQSNRYEDPYSNSQTKANPQYSQGSYTPTRRNEYQSYPAKSENAWGNQGSSWNYSQPQQRPQYQEVQPRGLNPQGSDKNWDSWDN
ncbi:unnamed protein product [Blepharisma stoltei]|uniref:PH domain-containing protein n=1 Tax=Blepharisma stoltei TaxID=1481888 RepID=A0AAU9K795_9CILI|nr:unnamed protein product [Blepharisma stoltei]